MFIQGPGDFHSSIGVAVLFVSNVVNRFFLITILKQIEYTQLNCSSYYAALDKTKDMIKMGKVSNEIFLKADGNYP